MMSAILFIISFFLLTFIFGDFSIFFHKISIFDKNSTFVQTNIVRALLTISLVLFTVFVREKVGINQNVSSKAMRQESGFCIAPNWP